MKQVHWLVAKQSVERRVKNKENQSAWTQKLVPVYLHTFRTQYEVLGVEVPHANIRTHSMHQILPMSPFRTYFAHKLHIHLSYYHAPAHKNARESALPSSGPHTHPHTFTNCILDDTLQPKPLWHWVPSFAARSYVATRARIFVRRSKASNSIPCKAAGKQKL